jgi:hypothetical protein
MAKPTVKEYIKHVMQRDDLPWSKARRIAIEEIRTGKALGQVKIKALGEALDEDSGELDKLDDVLALMEDDDD